MMGVRAPTVLVVVALLGSPPPPAVAQQSTSYRLERVATVATASGASSATFATTVLLGQQSPAGAASSCNSGYRQSFGFWSVLGDLPVPIILRVDRVSENPVTVGLTWSGSDENFELYRATHAAGLIQSGNLALVTSQCSATDDNASELPLVFYSIVPTDR